MSDVGDDYYQNEFNAFDRAGFMPGAMAAGMDASDRFRAFVDRIAREINRVEERTVFHDDSITLMQDKSTLVPKIEYKSPVAYVFGFLATNGGRALTERSFRDATSLLSIFDTRDYGVRPEDLLRYARLWLELYKKSS